MRFTSLLLTGTWLGSGVVLGQNSCSNVIIASPSDVQRLQGCTTVKGNLTLAGTLRQNISTTAVEQIEGSLVALRCFNTTGSPQGCPGLTAPHFSVSLPALRRVNGSIEIRHDQGLTSFSLPNLDTIGGELRVETHFLKQLDIKSLKRVHSILIHDAGLDDLTLDGLEEMTGTGTKTIDLRGLRITNYDGFFRGTVETGEDPELVRTNRAPRPNRTEISLRDLFNGTRINFGWRSASSITIVYGEDYTFAFGNYDGVGGDRGVDIGRMSFQYPNGFEIERDASLRGELTVGQLEIAGNSLLRSVSLPFDEVRLASVSGDRIQEIKYTSAKALAGEMDFRKLRYNAPLNLNLTGEENDQGQRVWTWPKREMESVEIYASNIQQDFFKSFLEQRNPENQGDSPARPKVTRMFKIQGSLRSNFSCDPFNKLRDQGVLPKGDNTYLCFNGRYDNDNIAMGRGCGMAKGLLGGAVLAVVIFSWL